MSAEFKKSETPKAETKHATLLTAEQELAALLASPDCLHPELPLTNEDEKLYLNQLTAALEKNELDKTAYEELLGKLNKLSLAVIHRFANACYQHWQSQYPIGGSIQSEQLKMVDQTFEPSSGFRQMLLDLKELKKLDPHTKLIANLQLAALYYRRGRVMNTLVLDTDGQAVGHFQHAMGAIAHYSFTQQQPPLPQNLITAAKQLRSLIDDAILTICKQTLKDQAPSRIPESDFTPREQMLEGWRHLLTTALSPGVVAAHTTYTDDVVVAHSIYTSNTKFAHDLLGSICREIEQQIGPPPCSYTLAGAGSFSRDEVSPASDLDCAVLVKDSSIGIIDKDSSDNITFHPWFECFLRLMQWKLASLPTDILALERDNILKITRGYWFDTPEGLIEQHLTSQQPNNRGTIQQAENFGAQWLRWIYSSGNRPQQEDQLFEDYQSALKRVFHPRTNPLPHTPIDDNSLPNYRQLASWSLKQHMGESLASSNEPTVLDVKKLCYRVVNAILCYGRFNGVPSGITSTREMLAYLKERQCLPPTFITQLQTALDKLYTWRLYQHWAWLHSTSSLKKNEVVLWPEDPAQQATLQALPSEQRGFYLDETETQQHLPSIIILAEIIERSVEGLAAFAMQLPASTLPSSSTTTTSEEKEAKREVDEVEANAILARQTSPPATPIFNPLAAAVNWTLQQLAKPKEEKTSTEEPTKAQSKHLIWLAQAIQFGLPPGQEQQQVLEQLFAPTSNTTLTLEQQRYLLTVLVGAQYHHLDLRPFKTILTDKLLLSILRNADNQILELNLSGCTQLTSGILKEIERYCPYLKRLQINDQTNWKNIYIGNFAELTTLKCNRATALTDIRFGQLPKLEKLSLADAINLEVLGNKGYWTSLATESTYAWSLPQLQQLNTQNCVLLRAVYIIINNPQALIWQRQGCIALYVKVPSIFSDWSEWLVDTLKTNAPSDSLDLHNKTLANLSIHSKISFTTTQALDDHVSPLLSTSSSSSSITTASPQTQHAVPLQATAEASDSEDDESKQSPAPISSMRGSPLTANGSSRSISTPPTTSTSSSSYGNSHTGLHFFPAPQHPQPTAPKETTQATAESKSAQKNPQEQQQSSAKQASEEFSEDGVVDITPINTSNRK